MLIAVSLNIFSSNRDERERERERSTLFFLAVGRVRGSVLDGQPLDHVYEIRHKARHQTLQGCRVAAQDELVDDPRLVELLDHCNAHFPRERESRAPSSQEGKGGGGRGEAKR